MKTISVIWLEDDEKFIKKFDKDFQDLGINIIPCNTSAQALRQIESGSSDFLLLDVEFPVGERDGIVFLESLALSRPSIRTIIFTNYPQFPEASELFRSGKILDYIQKPNPKKAEVRRRLILQIKDLFLANDKPNDKELLKRWRLRGWYRILLAFFISVPVFLFLLLQADWEVEEMLNRFAQNKILAIAMAFIWAIVNTFLIKDLYNKYYNYSNINNYLNRAIKT